MENSDGMLCEFIAGTKKNIIRVSQVCCPVPVEARPFARDAEATGVYQFNVQKFIQTRAQFF